MASTMLRLILRLLIAGGLRTPSTTLPSLPILSGSGSSTSTARRGKIAGPNGRRNMASSPRLTRLEHLAVDDTYTIEASFQQRRVSLAFTLTPEELGLMHWSRLPWWEALLILPKIQGM